MGGTLAHRGGHNILEPAAAGKPVIVGPHLENFAEIQQRFRAGRGMREIASSHELQTSVLELLRDGAEFGERARSLAEAERGATDRAVHAVVEARWNTVPRNVPPLGLRLLSQLWIGGGVVKRATSTRRKLPRPVISIGGLSMGGAGKTPVVRALARALKEQGLQPAVLTRGYKRVTRERVTVLQAGSLAAVELTGDEAQTILRDGYAHVGIGADRYGAGMEVMQQLRPDVFLLDDGFQHARLERDLDIVVLDGLDPFAGGWPFPAGRLREPVSALKRAQVVALSRVEGRRFDGILERIGETPVVLLSTKPVYWVECASGRRVPVDAFQLSDCAAFCGLGNPEAFRATLNLLGYKPVTFRAFPDHHRYSAADLIDLRAEVLLTTEKDAVKLSGLDVPRIWYLVIETDIHPLLAHIHRVFTNA